MACDGPFRSLRNGTAGLKFLVMDTEKEGGPKLLGFPDFRHEFSPQKNGKICTYPMVGLNLSHTLKWVDITKIGLKVDTPPFLACDPWTSSFYPLDQYLGGSSDAKANSTIYYMIITHCKKMRKSLRIVFLEADTDRIRQMFFESIFTELILQWLHSKRFGDQNPVDIRIALDCAWEIAWDGC